MTSAESRGASADGGEQPSLVMRPLLAADLPILVELWKASGLTIRPAGREHPERLAAELSEYPDNFLGAFEGGALVGACIASWDGRRGWINRLAVRPDKRRSGVAQQLVKSAEAQLKSRGALIIAALVEPENAASLALFARLGYRDVPSAVYLSKRDGPDV